MEGKKKKQRLATEKTKHINFHFQSSNFSAEDHMPGMVKRSSLSQSILINGHGRYFNVSFFVDLQLIAVDHLQVSKLFQKLFHNYSTKFHTENNKLVIVCTNSHLSR
jgi:hypothetical protein